MTVLEPLFGSGAHTELLDTLAGTYTRPNFDQYTVTTRRTGGHLEYASDKHTDGRLVHASSSENAHVFTEVLTDRTEQQNQFVQRRQKPTQLFLERHALLSESAVS